MKDVAELPDHRVRLARLWTRGQFLVLAAAAAAAIATLLAMCGSSWWLLELFAHFRCQYLAVLTIGILFCVRTDRWKAAATLGLFAAVNLAVIIPYYLPPDNSNAEGRAVRLLLANVDFRNHDHARFLQLVRKEAPDVIVVPEASNAWLRALENLAAEYPYRISRPRDNSFGIAILARLPTTEIEVWEFGPLKIPAVVARVDCGENVAMHLVAAHPPAPISRELAAMRNEQLQKIGRDVGALPRPTVLIGDMNTTSWSPVFRNLLDASGLRDSRQGFGVQPTWPSWAAMIGIPIDHVLVSSDIVVELRRIGPDISSDHRPVIVDLRILPTQ